MNSDSESQDSDDGRRFRFATTRKDAVPSEKSKRNPSPRRGKRSERRSRSRDKSSRDDRSRHSKDDSFRKKRSPRRSDSGSPSRSRRAKDGKSSNRDSNRKKQEKESRSQHLKDFKNNDSKDSKDSKERSNFKYKSKSKEKHKKHSRDRSQEKSQPAVPENTSQKEEKKVDSFFISNAEEVKVEKQKSAKSHSESIVKDSRKRAPSEERKIESSSNGSAVISGILSQTFGITQPSRKKKKSLFERMVYREDKNDDSYYGPTLPPQLERMMIKSKEAEELKGKKEMSPASSDGEDQQVIGPALPLSSVQSPKLVENNLKEKVEKMEEEETKQDEEEDEFGPILPPGMERRKVVGPILPKNFVVPSSTNDDETENLKSNDEDDEDDDIVGPLPADHPDQNSFVQMQLECRARKVKEKFRNKSTPEKNKREEWMTELPPSHAVALGLGSIPRKFKTSEGPDMSDRTMWTDTPEDRLRKEKEKEENRFVPSEKSSKKSKSKDKDDKERHIEERKSESLLDMHLKTLKKKKKKLEKEAKELGLSTRRPFDRDVDLQANRLDDARKKKIFQKASLLNDRFTVGKI